MDVTDLPFNALIGIERAEANNALLRLPSDPRYPTISAASTPVRFSH